MHKIQIKSVEIILKLVIPTLFLVRVARFELAASRPQNVMLKNIILYIDNYTHLCSTVNQIDSVISVDSACSEAVSGQLCGQNPAPRRDTAPGRIAMGYLI